MADDDSSTFKLDLDASDFISSAEQAKSAISGLGNAEGLEDLITSLTEVGAVVGVLGVAFFAVKGIFDEVFDAENIEAVSNQFTILSERAGQYSDVLKNGLKTAADGWVDDTTLMQAANKAMIGLQTGVEKLPELMALARGATQVFGGSLVDNFNIMTRAVETGNVRQLKGLGIIIDQKKAYDDFAKTVGVSADSLSEAGKQQAILNAVLAKGAESQRGLTATARESITAWMQVKAAFTEMGEVIALAFNKIAGPAVRSFFGWLQKEAQETGDVIKIGFGDKAEATAGRIDLLTKHLSDLRDNLKQLQETQERVGKGDPIQAERRARDITKLNQEILQTKLSLNQLGAAAKAAEEQSKTATAGAGSPVDPKKSMVDIEKVKAELKKYQQDAEKVSQQLTQQQIKDMDSVAEADRLYNVQRLAEVKKVDEQIKAAKKQLADSEKLEAAAKAAGDKQLLTQAVALHKTSNDQIAALNKLRDAKEKGDDDQLAAMRLQALQKYQSESETAFEGVGRAFKTMSAQNQNALKQWGDYGTSVTNSFASHSVSALQAWGAGTKSAGAAVEGFFGSMVGDMATNYGKMLLLASVWPPNPVGLAAGAGLIALGGYLGSLGGGAPSGAAVSASSPSDTAATQSVGAAIASGPLNGAASTSTGPKSTQIIIQGNMLMSSQTQRWLVDQVRAASDSQGIQVQNSTGSGL